MKTLTLTLLLSLLFQQSVAQSFTFNYQGTDRSYVLHLPPNYTAGIQYPLVLNFHGLTQTGAEQQSNSKMDAVADQNNFIVVYPDGLNNSWNAGINNGDVDDVGFINSLLDYLITNYSIDENRVYSTGFSMGGYFSYKLACELGHRIAAIAPVSGLMATTVAANCNPGRDIPVLHFHGTSDGIVSYNGTYSLSVEETLAWWRTNNECSAQADTIHYPDIDPNDGSTVDLIQFNDCESSSEVSHFKLYNERHTWPGSDSWGANQDINASQEIWDFFSQYSLNDAVTAIVVPAEDRIAIAPQPFTDETTLSFNLPEKVISIRIVDMKGTEIFKTSALEDTEIKTGRNLTKGIYLVYIITGSATYIEKIIKQ